jgi:hypothetical protein
MCCVCACSLQGCESAQALISAQLFYALARVWVNAVSLQAWAVMCWGGGGLGTADVEALLCCGDPHAGCAGAPQGAGKQFGVLWFGNVSVYNRFGYKVRGGRVGPG